MLWLHLIVTGCSTTQESSPSSADAVWAQALARFDRDQDGLLTAVEYGTPTNLEAPFAKGDLDGSGTLDVSEFRHLILTQAPRFQRDLKKRRAKAMPGKLPKKEDIKVATRTAEEVAKVRALLERQAQAPSPPPTPNILIVGLDTVRADRTSAYGYQRDTTPNLAALAQRGVVFEAAISNGNESLYAHTNLWTAKYASEAARPIYETFVIPETATSMAEVLQAYGYRTGAFVAGGHLDPAFGHSQGFDTYETQVGFGSLWTSVPQSLEWIDAGTDGVPWMAYVHGYDAHAPYRTAAPFGHGFYGGDGEHPTDALMIDPMLPERIFRDTFYPGQSIFFEHPEGFRILSTETYTHVAQRPKGHAQPFGREDAAHLRDHYDGCLAYADLHLGLLLAALEDRGVLEHTLVLVVGDHGEDLLDHDFVNHRTALYDGVVRVPLVAAGPGFASGQRVSALTQLLDVLPTVLRTAQAQVPAGSRGRALQDVASGAAPELKMVFSEGVMDMVSARTRTHKLIAKGFSLAAPDLIPALAKAEMGAAHFELYDLQSDPREQANLLRHSDDATLAVGEELRRALVRWRMDISIGTAAQDPSKVDPKVADQLRQHGYWKTP